MNRFMELNLFAEWNGMGWDGMGWDGMQQQLFSVKSPEEKAELLQRFTSKSHSRQVHLRPLYRG